MENGWKCPNCSNVYAPNIPFCLYCWFNKNNTQAPTIPMPTPVTISESVPVIT